MIDFYYHLRQKMITRMQTSLKQIRQVLGFGVQEFSELIGLTRQTINNLETKKNKMSSTQYIAICALIDNYTKDKSELLSAILNILASNDEEYINDSLDNDVNKSFLKEWFLSFPDNSKILNFSIDEISTIEDKYFNEIAENYKIFLDNTILLEESFQNKVQTFAKAMEDLKSTSLGIIEENNNKFIVPFKVIEDIQRQILASNKNITRGINILEELQNKNLIDIRGEVTDIDINSTFLSVFAKFKSLYRLALITNNLNLASQISVLNNENIKGFNILLLKYEKNIGIKKWEEFTDIQSVTSEAKKNINENFIGWETIN